MKLKSEINCEGSEGLGQIYEEWLLEYPKVSPNAIVTALRFMEVAAHFDLTQDSLFSKFGLTSGRFSLLLLLKREAQSPSELAKKARVSKATMTQFIDSLENDQLVKRRDDPNDRRAMKIILTTKGENLLKKVMPDHLKRLEHFSQVLSCQQLKQLLQMLEKLAQGIEEQEE